jgi:hypothetical protein
MKKGCWLEWEREIVFPSVPKKIVLRFLRQVSAQWNCPCTSYLLKVDHANQGINPSLKEIHGGVHTTISS